MLSFVRGMALCFIICFSVAVSYAQKKYPRSELEFSYGVYPLPEVSGANKKLFALDLYGKEIDKSPGTGSFAFAYNHFLSQRFTIGFTALYDKITVSYKDVSSKLNWNVMAVLLNAKYNYVYDPRFHMYSGLSAGYAAVWATLPNSTERNNRLAFQARVLGARFGNTVGGFGYEGVVKAGLSLQF
jgi:hypothetical protein